MHISQQLIKLRRNRVVQVKGWLNKVDKEKREIDDEKLILKVMSKMGASNRTAKELIKVAKYEYEEFKIRSRQLAEGSPES